MTPIPATGATRLAALQELFRAIGSDAFGTVSTLTDEGWAPDEVLEAYESWLQGWLRATLAEVGVIWRSRHGE